MQKTCYILFMLLAVTLTAQTALYNSGNLRIHENGNLGFHTNLINEAPFDTNLGLVGFYSPTELTVSGTIVPLFFDTEIATENGLHLELGIDNTNNTSFIVGDILSPRTQDNTYYNFLKNSFYLGEGNLNKIDGYAAITNKQNFIFPVGDSELLRPLILDSESTNLFAKCAYFFENPNAPVSRSGNFDTDNTARNIELVSTSEFWRLESTVVSTVNVSWNARSSMESLTDDSTTLVLVGWSKLGNRWENLGATSVLGNLEQGFITSEPFLPSDYEILTLGSSKIPFEPLARAVVRLENYFVSPNGDNINDTFFVPELENSENNIVTIYDRYGIKVFKKSNYTNDFSGTANVGNFIFNRNQGLPSGIYFYTIFMIDLNLDYQGFLYLTNK
ncbi:gliding motility-associated C-terminal domain-containing protein [Maribacter antarcticus]|uniref:gliding motility-associated C-terminal domain-containing protein n=1 Tax=Maribacter antarcticus TaxID=505250 RepID=UPI00047EA4A1|nr:T9SS C-terminal target domain-containing protein [Maribacter antarcticus]